jgi:hypothetical protein
MYIDPKEVWIAFYVTDQVHLQNLHCLCLLKIKKHTIVDKDIDCFRVLERSHLDVCMYVCMYVCVCVDMTELSRWNRSDGYYFSNPELNLILNSLNGVPEQPAPDYRVPLLAQNKKPRLSGSLLLLTGQSIWGWLATGMTRWVCENKSPKM